MIVLKWCMHVHDALSAEYIRWAFVRAKLCVCGCCTFQVIHVLILAGRPCSFVGWLRVSTFGFVQFPVYQIACTLYASTQFTYACDAAYATCCHCYCSYLVLRTNMHTYSLRSATRAHPTKLVLNKTAIVIRMHLMCVGLGRLIASIGTH